MFTYSINGSVIAAGVWRHGDTLWTALVRRNPQTLALQREHTGQRTHAGRGTGGESNVSIKIISQETKPHRKHKVSIIHEQETRNLLQTGTGRNLKHEESLKYTFQRRRRAGTRSPSPGSRVTTGAAGVTFIPEHMNYTRRKR